MFTDSASMSAAHDHTGDKSKYAVSSSLAGHQCMLLMVQGCTVLHHAAHGGCDQDSEHDTDDIAAMYSTLIQAGADANARNCMASSLPSAYCSAYVSTALAFSAVAELPAAQVASTQRNG